VLVIDDDPVALALGQAALENRGHQVLTLDRALGATALILRERPRAVVVDVQMPGLSGDEWVRMLHERNLLGSNNAIAFILHSGERSDELERLVRETGALGGIVKRGDAHAFAAAFERLVADLPSEP